jgi:hypothetical protein
MTASKYLQKLLSLHGIHIDKIIKGGKGGLNDPDFKDQVLQRANEYYKKLYTDRANTPRIFSYDPNDDVIIESNEKDLIRDASTGENQENPVETSIDSIAAAAAVATNKANQENPVETSIDSIAAAAAVAAASTERNQENPVVNPIDIDSIASAAAVAAVSTERNQENPIVKPIDSNAAAAAASTEENKVNTIVKHDTDINSIAAAAAAAAAASTEEKEDSIVKDDRDIASIAAAAVTQQNEVNPLVKEDSIVKDDTDIASIATAAAVAAVTETNQANTILKDTGNEKGVENVENIEGNQVTQINSEKVMQYIREYLSTFKSIKFPSFNFSRINFGIVDNIGKLNIDLGLKEKLKNLWSQIDLRSFFQNLFQRKEKNLINNDVTDNSATITDAEVERADAGAVEAVAGADAAVAAAVAALSTLQSATDTSSNQRQPIAQDSENRILTILMKMFMAMGNIPISEFMKIITTPIFKSLDPSDQFAILLTKTIKDGFKSVSKTKPTPTANIKQIENGIDPKYGGGFIMFDDKFKIAGVIHSGYHLSTSEIKMSNSTTNSNDINTFVSQLKSGCDSCLPLDISKIVESIKVTVKLPNI